MNIQEIPPPPSSIERMIVEVRERVASKYHSSVLEKQQSLP